MVFQDLDAERDRGAPAVSGWESSDSPGGAWEASSPGIEGNPRPLSTSAAIAVGLSVAGGGRCLRLLRVGRARERRMLPERTAGSCALPSRCPLHRSLRQRARPRSPVVPTPGGRRQTAAGVCAMIARSGLESDSADRSDRACPAGDFRTTAAGTISAPGWCGRRNAAAIHTHRRASARAFAGADALSIGDHEPS